MKFTELKPLLIQNADHHSLTFNCPECKMRIGIKVRLNEKQDEKRAIWMLTGDFDSGNWNTATVTPSIGDHQRGRKGWPDCNAHISVTNGEVT